MSDKAFQDHYTDIASHCYGCGRLNEQGLQIKSYWDGNESVCQFEPKPHHTAFPGFVYGGLIASLIDCHATGTAAAHGYKTAGRPMGTGDELRYVTGTLNVRYLRPTPIEGTLELRGRVTEVKGKKTVVAVDLLAKGERCAVGEVIVFQAPADFMASSPS